MSGFIVPSNKESVITAGTTLLTCKPFASVLNTVLAKNHCDHCFRKSDSSAKETDHLSTCGGCHLVRYCDRSCQKGGWNNGHRWECKGFQAHGKLPPQFSRLLFRIITKLHTNADVYDRVSPKITRRFKDLMSHYREIQADLTRMEHIRTCGKVVESLLAHQKGIIMPNESELVAICGRLFVNTFSITDSELHQLGTGLYLGASIFDHSCEPIAVATFHSTTISIRNIVDYPASLPIDKVTISYQDTLRPANIRKPNLQAIYYFECQCIPCTISTYDMQMTSILCPNQTDGGTCNSDLHIDIDEKCDRCNTKLDEAFIRKVKEAEEMVKTKQLEMHTVSYLDVCEACLNVMKSLSFSKVHWLMTSMATSAFDASIDMQRWEKAFTYGHLALEGYRKHLAPMHPLLGITLLKLAKLCWFMEKEDLAKAYIEESKRIIDITHGPSSELALHEVFTLAQEIKSFSKN